MKKKINHFFLPKIDLNKKVVLGLSGGPDSLCLFYNLIDCKIPFVVAHVDHGWREVSSDEAKFLEKLTVKYGLPFYLKTLNPAECTGNKEEFCRKQRLQFFKEVVKQEGAAGVVLGHHADDLAETVLKRVLEGSSLQAIPGMKEVSDYEGMSILRPLLKCRKKDILKDLEMRGVSGFVDETNEDPRFLRARMRSEILPHLALQFGKEVVDNLCYLSEQMREVSEHIEEKIAPILAKVKREEGCVSLDFSLFDELTKVELKAAIRVVCREVGISLSRENVELVVGWILSGASKKQVESSNRRVVVDRKQVLFQNHD